MSTLPELQREFARAIRQPDANIAGLRAVVNGRMGIYTDGYKTRLRDALRINFPALHRVLGDDAFTDLAHRYIDAMPSAYRSIRWFGRELEDFSRRDAANLSHPALLDLLRMDSLRVAAYVGGSASTPSATQRARYLAAVCAASTALPCVTRYSHNAPKVLAPPICSSACASSLSRMRQRASSASRQINRWCALASGAASAASAALSSFNSRITARQIGSTAQSSLSRVTDGWSTSAIVAHCSGGTARSCPCVKGNASDASNAVPMAQPATC